MKEYTIYNMYTDEVIGEVKANSITDAEIKASEKYDISSADIYALTKSEPTKHHMTFHSEEEQKKFEAKLKLDGFKKTADCMWAKIYTKDNFEIVINREW